MVQSHRKTAQARVCAAGALLLLGLLAPTCGALARPRTLRSGVGAERRSVARRAARGSVGAPTHSMSGHVVMAAGLGDLGPLGGGGGGGVLGGAGAGASSGGGPGGPAGPGADDRRLLIEVDDPAIWAAEKLELSDMAQSPDTPAGLRGYLGR